jgi:thiamine biosynthesis lipoprotein
MNLKHPEKNADEAAGFSIPNLRRFAHAAMATTFEIVVVHPDAEYCRQAAWAAFEELDRLEQELSRFVENSDISRLNALASRQTVQVGEAAFDCVQIAQQMYNETGGTFDISVGTGIKHLKLNKSRLTVKAQKEGIQLDLGGIGKGYAVDRIVESLQEWDLRIALIHGGQSSVRALEAPPGSDGWPVTLSIPGRRHRTLGRAAIRHQALSGSGMQKGTHIIDPQTRQPVENRRAVWVCLPAAPMDPALPSSFPPDALEMLSHPATFAETLSTAFIVMPLEGVQTYCSGTRPVGALVAVPVSSGDSRQPQLLQLGGWEIQRI